MDNSEFEGKVAIVTGAAIGIGFEISRQLAARGARVLLNDLDEAAAEAAGEKIRSASGICQTLAGDAADPDFVYRLVDTAVDTFGRVDMAIANAGITAESSLLDIAAVDLQRMLNLNLQGSVFLAQAAGKRMIQQGDGGRIIFMSSVTGHQAHDNLVCYGMTKAALQMLAKGLVIEFAPHGITTNAISPGAVLTERTVRADPDYASKWQATTPTGKVCTPKDIAEAALFLVSKKASQITGQTLVVDGGWIATSPVPEV